MFSEISGIGASIDLTESQICNPNNDEINSIVKNKKQMESKIKNIIDNDKNINLDLTAISRSIKIDNVNNDTKISNLSNLTPNRDDLDTNTNI